MAALSDEFKFKLSTEEKTEMLVCMERQSHVFTVEVAKPRTAPNAPKRGGGSSFWG